jgi:hypothetical protein
MNWSPWPCWRRSVRRRGAAGFRVDGYQEAGVIAFFMLMGQIIETRTAEGARASIESLIKLTPPKARRVTKPPARRKWKPRILAGRRCHPRSARRQRRG